MPAEALALFQTSQSEMRSFLASNLQPLYENTELAIEKNNYTLDNLAAQIEETFTVDPVEISAAVSNEKEQIELNLGILGSMKKIPRLWDILSR